MITMKKGYADLPLHGGKAPAWLFERMILLSREISQIIIEYFGKEEFLNKISDPIWFQSFGCVLGFDWHSSGVTTTVTGSLKEGLKPLQHELGLYFAGGKGKRGINTPLDIDDLAEKGEIEDSYSKKLKNISRLVAKVDTCGVQDGYSLYHHFLIFTKEGQWAVIQQGMKDNSRYARRYHWYSKELKSFVSDPHKGVVASIKEEPLNLIDSKIEKTRNDILYFVKEAPIDEADRIKDLKELTMPKHHPIFDEDYDVEKLKKILINIKETNPEDFENLLLVKGLGAKNLRALSLISHLIFNSELSFKDPATYSFAHGGKDGYPFPVDKKTYDESIEILKEAVNKAKIGSYEKINAIKRLSCFEKEVKTN
jgi:uncharacterized protein